MKVWFHMSSERSVMNKLEKQIHVRMSKRTYEALENASQRIGVSIAWIIRYATQDYLARKGYLTK